MKIILIFTDFTLKNYMSHILEIKKNNFNFKIKIKNLQLILKTLKYFEKQMLGILLRTKVIFD